jgi:hypothetical protein
MTENNQKDISAQLQADFNKALDQFELAARRLYAIWDTVISQTGEIGHDRYPFQEEFGEIVINISEWVNYQKLQASLNLYNQD